MPPPSLYVCKAARRPRYRHENLHLLAAERGRVVEASYNPMWVAPELLDDGAIPRGAPVYFLLTDRPYTHFAPVRQGEVLEVERDELLVRLRILLRGWIAAPGGDVEAFTRAVRERSPAEAPGQKFVLRKRDDVVFERFFDDREDEGWRSAVDATLAMSRAAEDDPYRASVFFRPLGLRVGGELHEARRVPLEPGADAALALRFYNPHLSGGDAARHTLRVLTSDDARARVPEHFPLTGDVEIPFEAIGPRPELTVEIGPAPVEHTAVTERFRAGVGAGVERRHAVVREPTRSRDAGLATVVDAMADHLPADDVDPGDGGPAPAVLVAGDELLRLYDLVRRNARFESADELDVLDAFQRLLPREQVIAERKARVHAERGEGDVAYRILRCLDPERLGDDARFLLFRATVERESGPAAVQRVLSLDLAADGRFPRLLEELSSIEKPALARLLPELVMQLPADQVREVVARVGPRVESGEAAAKLAEALYVATGDAAWAYTYLDERRQSLRLADPIVTDTLLDLAASGGRMGDGDELGEDAARRIGNLIERGELADARARLTQAGRGLGRTQRDRLYHRITDRLRDRGDHAAAAEIMVELAWAAAETGDLESATEAVQRARGLWGKAEAEAQAEGNGGAAEARANAGGSDDTAAGASGPTGTDAAPSEPRWLRDAIRHVEAAWRACEALVEWRRTEEERLREQLRARYLNRRILIAGGFRRQEWIGQLEDLTGATVDWAERYRDEGDDLSSFAQRIRNGSYAVVVHLWQKSGHEVGDRLKAACEEAGVPWVYARSAGVRGVVEGVAEATRS